MGNILWPFQIGIIAAIIGNALWYWIKSINKTNGYKVNLFTHSGDFKNFKEIIKNENDPESKKKYQRILKGIYGSIFVLMASFITTVIIVMLQRS